MEIKNQGLSKMQEHARDNRNENSTYYTSNSNQNTIYQEYNIIYKFSNSNN